MKTAPEIVADVRTASEPQVLSSELLAAVGRLAIAWRKANPNAPPCARTMTRAEAKAAGLVPLTNAYAVPKQLNLLCEQIKRYERAGVKVFEVWSRPGVELWRRPVTKINERKGMAWKPLFYKRK